MVLLIGAETDAGLLGLAPTRPERSDSATKFAVSVAVLEHLQMAAPPLTLRRES